MEENKNFDIKNIFKGKNLAIVILSIFLFFSLLALGSSDTSITNQSNNTVTQLQEKVKTLENEKKNLQSENAELEKQMTELKKIKENEPTQPTSHPISSNVESIEKYQNTPSQSTPLEEPVNNKVEADYVININTKKFHYSSCSSVKQIKSSNRKDFSGTRDELINQGYEPCKKCNP